MKSRLRAATVLATAMVVGLGGCSGGSDGNTPSGAASAANPTTRAKLPDPAALDPDAPVRIATTFTTTTWDPTTQLSPVTGFPYLAQVYDRLLLRQSDGSVAPMLATKWDFSNGGKSLTMDLRHDVTFHDGSTFDGDVAVSNLDRNRGETSPLASSLANVEKVTATDRYQVRIDMKHADPTLLYTLSYIAGIMVSPKGIANPHALATAPAGSGPFDLASADQQKTVFAKAKDYWDDSLFVPNRKEIWYITDPTARLNGFKTGQLDMINVKPDMLPAVDKVVNAGDGSLYAYAAYANYMMQLNTKTGPTADPDVRKAIALAVDRKAVNQGIFHGQCPPGGATVPKGFAGYVDDFKDGYPYDPDHARRALSRAGSPDVTIRAVSGNTVQLVLLQQVLKNQLAKVGINLEITKLENTAAYVDFNAGKYDMYIQQNTPPTPDLVNLVDQIYLPDTPVNSPSPDLAPLVSKARPLPLESDERKAALENINRFLWDWNQTVMVCQIKNMYLYKPNVAGYDSQPFANLLDAQDARYVAIKK